MGLHVAVVGLGFGNAFLPLYQGHPGVERVSICDLNPGVLARVGDEFGLENRHSELADVLEDPSIDAVHLLSPVPYHVEQTLAVLQARKHCACAVPMATSLEDIRRIIDAVQTSGKRYMMMETGAYTREFLYAWDLLKAGKLGELSLLQGNYFQDLEAPYPDYWRRVPPMHYATHCIGPILALAQTRAKRVSCLGGPPIRQDICDDPRNPFPLQSAQFRLEGSRAVVQVNRAWYQTAREYVESFSVYGSKMGFEWQQLEGEDPVLFELEPVQSDVRWRNAEGKRVAVPFRPDLYPVELAKFADGGHGGSHPHLVHEFVSSILEDRPSQIDEFIAADWCAPGICAHESSLQEGAWIEVPNFR